MFNPVLKLYYRKCGKYGKYGKYGNCGSVESGLNSSQNI